MSTHVVVGLKEGSEITEVFTDSEGVKVISMVEKPNGDTAFTLFQGEINSTIVDEAIAACVITSESVAAAHEEAANEK